MAIDLIGRRTFNQILAMSAAAAALLPVPAWAQSKKRSVIMRRVAEMPVELMYR